MTQEPQDREFPEEAGTGLPEECDARSAELAAELSAPPMSLPITADGGSLTIGDVDLRDAREILAELGARGSTVLDRLSAEESIALLAGIVDIEAALEAVRVRAIVRLEQAVKDDCLRRDENARQATNVARSEASRVLKQSRSVAGRSMATSRRLVQSMPGMLTALARNALRAQSVHKIGSSMGPVTPEVREQVDELLTAQLSDLKDCGTGEIGDHVAKALHSLDPAGAADRHREAKKERHVTIRRADHGMATVTALIPAIDGARIRKGLSVAAEGARAHGDRRGHQQIMADLFTDALIGRGDGVDPSALEVCVVITDRSLFVPAHADAASIEGFGSVPYEHVREEMLRVAKAEEDTELSLTMRRLYTDPDDGQLVAVESRSRAFPTSLTRFLTLAHQTCRAPHCDASIRQMDHIVPWSEGGETSLENGNGLCAADNQKESAGEKVEVVLDEDGVRRTVRWTSRYGQSASRRGINFDPVGTYTRQLERERRQRGELSPGPSAPEQNFSLLRALENLQLRLPDVPLPARIIRPQDRVDVYCLGHHPRQ